MSFKRFFHWLITTKTIHCCRSLRYRVGFIFLNFSSFRQKIQNKWKTSDCYRSGSQLLTWPKLLGFIAFMNSCRLLSHRFLLSGLSTTIHGCLSNGFNMSLLFELSSFVFFSCVSLLLAYYYCIPCFPIRTCIKPSWYNVMLFVWAAIVHFHFTTDMIIREKSQRNLHFIMMNFLWRVHNYFV